MTWGLSLFSHCWAIWLICVSYERILKAGFHGFRNLQIILNFLQRDFLRTLGVEVHNFRMFSALSITLGNHGEPTLEDFVANSHTKFFCLDHLQDHHLDISIGECPKLKTRRCSTLFDNFEICWQCWPFLTILEFLTIFTMPTIFNYFFKFWQWVQFWQWQW